MRRALLLGLLAALAALPLRGYVVTPDTLTRSLAEAVKISNGKVEARFSLPLGRLLFFGPAGGKNLLWHESDKAISDYAKAHPKAYLNFGGDKVWPAAQCLWSAAFGAVWPPAPLLEGGTWQVVKQSAGSMTVRSEFLPRLGIELEREFTLPEGGTRLLVKTTARRKKASSYPVQLWSITQVKEPLFLLLEIPANAEPPYLAYKQPQCLRPAADGRLLFQSRCHAEFGAKSGTLGRYLAAVYPQGQVLMQFHASRAGGCYLEGASLQGFTCRPYAELETLDEAVHLEVGQSRTHLVVWSLLETETEKLNAEQLYPRLQQEAEMIQKLYFEKVR